MGRSSHSPTPADKAGPALLAPPIIDVSALRGDSSRALRNPEIAARINSACTEVGLFVVSGHSIDGQLSAAFAAARTFFALAPATKGRVPRINRYGYVPDRLEARDPADGAYKGRSSLIAEYLDMGLADEVDLDAIEALGCDGFVRAVRAYQAAALATAHGVLQPRASSWWRASTAPPSPTSEALLRPGRAEGAGAPGAGPLYGGVSSESDCG